MMALHELLTNSAKYGSLATEVGRIRISWHTEGNRLRFSWNGTGLHRSGPASRKGFGTLMLTEIVPRNLSGRARYEIEEGQVFWLLDIPFEASTSSPDDAVSREQPSTKRQMLAGNGPI
jgi:two-component sensor histidine kinase